MYTEVQTHALKPQHETQMNPIWSTIPLVAASVVARQPAADAASRCLAVTAYNSALAQLTAHACKPAPLWGIEHENITTNLTALVLPEGDV
jgi:hypothetical protein